MYDKSDDDNHDGKNNDGNDKKGGHPKQKEDQQPHRGFAFATFSSETHRQQAIDAGTVRGSAKPTSKRRHTLYMQPIVRKEDEETAADGQQQQNICFLWKKYRCPYGDNCKFVHEGDGGCANDTAGEGDGEKKKAVQKCFSFKKRGKCKLGDKCPFSHELVVEKNNNEQEQEHDSKKENEKGTKAKSQKDCINWKNKGKCRKGDKCPFRHDASVREKLLAKKKKNGNNPNNEKGNDDDGDANSEYDENGKKRKRDGKLRQSLSLRVFGLNYTTTETDIRSFFEECGTIVEITFPTFEDSGRSKGYCGVLFASPKAVQKAVEKDGQELHGRWLSIQEGKMYLRKWEEAENERRGDGKKSGGVGDGDGDRDGDKEPLVGEFGQKVKKRKKHGFKE